MSSQGPSNKEILLDAVAQTAGEHVLETVEPSDAIPNPVSDATPEEDFIPRCATQEPTPPALRNGPADIMVGLMGEVPRWVPGSTIRWAAWREGFKTQEDANYAAMHLHMAAEKWNELDIGVKFEWVHLAKDATFVLCHGGSDGNTMARAFFPNCNDLNYIYVYNAAFSKPTWKQNMWKVFTHELGHVLGLRHEFAMDTNPKSKDGSRFETDTAWQLGPRNESSVMNYGPKPPEIQPSDVDSTKAFYALREDEKGRAPKIGGTAVEDYTPM